jgi:hypothetical protein
MMTANASNEGSERYEIVPCELPLLIKDYYDESKGYRITDGVLPDCEVIRLSDSEKKAGLAGFGIMTTLSPETSPVLIAVLSHKQWISGDDRGPSFKSECWFKVGTQLMDLKEASTHVKWTNGILHRRFCVISGDKTIFDHEYPRPWKHELFRGHRDSDWHGPDDFFAYAHWAAKQK